MNRESWKLLSLENAIQIQNELRSKVIQNNVYSVKEFTAVAGIDLAYWKKGEEEYAVCCIVVLDQKTKQVIENCHRIGKIEVPYIPGCLAFRELPLILETVKMMETKPDLYMFDGNGYLHPRRMGIATHASFYLNRPTIGVAKHYYKVDDVDFIMPENEKNAYTDIWIQGEICGRVIRTLKDVKPVFVSVGNYIDLETATRIVCDFVTRESHIPLPTRLADLETHRQRSAALHSALKGSAGENF